MACLTYMQIKHGPRGLLGSEANSFGQTNSSNWGPRPKYPSSVLIRAALPVHQPSS